ncbi:MAG: hypothetical protein ACI8WT_002202 [Clostridium sp.]|jgi:hypothetical protein
MINNRQIYSNIYEFIGFVVVTEGVRTLAEKTVE